MFGGPCLSAVSAPDVPAPGADCASVNVIMARPANAMIAATGQRLVFLNFAIMLILLFIWFLFSSIPTMPGDRAGRQTFSSNLMIVCP
jgi:hypothetical protein